MLAYFPTPYPDELLFSVLSRLADTMQYPHRGDLSRALCGQDKRCVAVNLASHLEALLTALPPGHDLNAEKIIQEQTLFPFYQPFLAPERVRRLNEAMCQPSLAHVYLGMSLSHWKVPEPKWLRFCYDCLVDDCKQYGQGYWHRLHQVPGVKICPEHGAVLQESRASIYSRLETQRYVSAECALEGARSVPNPFSPAMQQTLLQIARDGDWLLQNDHSSITPASLRARFRLVLAEQGLATYQGRLYVPKFLSVFKQHYPSELLSLLDCPLDYDDARAWPVQAAHRENGETKHPLQYILVIRSLGYSVESFFALPTEAPYFGEGPWPCLNPVCDYHRQPVIETYHLDCRKLGMRPRATFACQTCGFTYRRLGPDTTPEDRYRTGRVLARGPLWEARLQQLRADPTLGPTEIARRLEADTTTIAGYVIGRPARQPGPEAQAQRYRAIWLEALQRFPEAKIGELNRNPEFRPAYTWLIHHDREWYQAHTRDGRKTRCLSPDSLKRRSIYLDGYRRNCDIRLAEEVRLAARQLLRQPGKPQKISPTAMCRYLSRNLPPSERFPVTARTLKAVAEPHEAFVVRRMVWAANDCYERGIPPTRKELMARAGVPSFLRHPRWKALAQEVLDRLASPGVHATDLIYAVLPSAQQAWPALDAQLAEWVVPAAERLKRQPGYPTRVTVSTIGIDLDRLEILLQHLEKLPQTAHLLARVVETDGAFATRVMEWIMAYAPDVDRSTRRTELVTLSGLQPYADIPAVSQIIDETFDRLQARNSHVETGVDWAARDQLLAPAVKKAAETLSLQPDSRITGKSIGRLIDEAGLLDVSAYEVLARRPGQLPLTNAALTEVVETPEQFAQRRWYQLAGQFLRQGIHPTKRQFDSIVSNIMWAASPVLRQTRSQILASLADLPSAHEVARQKKWAAIDAQLAPLIAPAAERLKAQPAPFVQVTKPALGNYLDQYWLALQRLEKLPQTAEALAQAVETDEEFALRRVKWWGAYYRDRQVRPSRWRFTKEAGVRHMVKRPRIQAAVSEVLQALSSFPTKREAEKQPS